jgi:LPS export ABC transporter protein LptC
MFDARTIMLIVALTAGALGSWYLARQQGGDAGSAAIESVHRGYYLKSARILGTGTNGDLLYEIQAERAEQQDDNRIEFSVVSINYSPQSQIPWTVNADTARIERDRKRILLSGHVTAISSEAGYDTEIRAPYLELDPENFLAETDARVQIRIGERSLIATGMLASLQDNTLELQSNVSGKFFP